MTDISSKQTSDILLVKEENLLNWNEVSEKFKKMPINVKKSKKCQ